MEAVFRGVAALCVSCSVLVLMAVPAFAQDAASELGAAAVASARAAIGQATLVVAVIIGFAMAYYVIRKVTG